MNRFSHTLLENSGMNEDNNKSSQASSTIEDRKKYSKMTNEDLRKIIHILNIKKGLTKLKKDDLINIIINKK